MTRKLSHELQIIFSGDLLVPVNVVISLGPHLKVSTTGTFLRITHGVLGDWVILGPTPFIIIYHYIIRFIFLPTMKTNVEFRKILFT